MKAMYDTVRSFYTEHGFGGRVGFGERPAVIVIDLAKAWVSADAPIGSDLDNVVANTRIVLDEARRVNAPVFFTTMAYDAEHHEIEGPLHKKLPQLRSEKGLIRGTEWVEVDSRLNRRTNEILIEKQRASAFWGTSLLSHLVARKIDTLLITGCSTSGCVRSTAESGHNYGFHTIVIAEAVGDRSATAHQCNIVDIDLRFADVTPLEEVMQYLSRTLFRDNKTTE